MPKVKAQPDSLLKFESYAIINSFVGVGKEVMGSINFSINGLCTGDRPPAQQTPTLYKI